MHRFDERDAVSGSFGHEPAVLEDLVEDFRGLDARPQVRWNLGHGTFKAFRDPLVCRDLLVFGTEPDLEAIGVEIVEKPAGLILLDIKSGESDESARVVTGVDHFRLDRDVLTVVGRHHLQFGEVEPEIVETADPSLKRVAIISGEFDVTCYLLP